MLEKKLLTKFGKDVIIKAPREEQQKNKERNEGEMNNDNFKRNDNFKHNILVNDVSNCNGNGY